MSCKGCTKRVLHCHSTCTEYLDFQRKQEEIKRKQRSEWEITGYVSITATNNRIKRMKRLNSPKKN